MYYYVQCVRIVFINYFINYIKQRYLTKIDNTSLING